MDRAEEFTFAWALLDYAAVFLDERDRAPLCIRIGAGEYREAIIELLQRFAISDTSLPPVLAASLWAWMNGFAGTAAESCLRGLAVRLRFSGTRSYPGEVENAVEDARSDRKAHEHSDHVPKALMTVSDRQFSAGCADLSGVSGARK